MPHEPHQLSVRIEASEDDDLYRGSIVEEETGLVHFAMSGPARPYREVVEEVLEALRRHLLAPGD